jgi:CO/xanthine dehydrogenase Mo-binding subunit
MADSPRRFIGQPIPRVDAPAKLTGSALYVGDLDVPGVQHAALVRSTVAHGRIRSIDTTAAHAEPDVTHIVMASDLAHATTTTRFGPVVRDCPLLAEDVVRYEGEPVALVVARTETAARSGAALVEVEYDDLPVLSDVGDAMATDMPRLHDEAATGEFGGAWASGWEPTRNIAGQYHDSRGNPAAAIAAAERIFEHTYRVPTIHHYAIENHVAIAIPSPDGITIHAANQYPFLMARLVADLLGIAESSVRVVVPFVGGAFGGKEYASILPLAAVVARLIDRPLRIEYTIEESFRTLVRHAAVMTYRTATTAQGEIVARQVDLRFDSGAYADQSPRVVRQAGYRSPGPYRIPNLRVDAFALYTNKVPAGAYRGFGASQPIFACESHTDEIAEELGVDPIEFRLRNLLRLHDDFSAGDLPLDCDLPEALRVAAEEMRRPRQHLVADVRRRGVGFAVGVKNTASGNLPSSAIVRLHRDGSATVLSSSVEIGQGTLTMLTQVAAEALSLDPARVRVTTPDTSVTPFDQRTSSSRSTIHMGLAVQRAAEDAVRRALAAAERILDVPAKRLRLMDGQIVGGGEPLKLRDLVANPSAGFGGEIIGIGHFVSESPETPTAFGMRAGYWEGSVGAAEVAVDPETGEVDVLRYVTVADAGTVINPLMAHGQEEGGAAMGMGHALFESCLFEEGIFLNPSIVDYRVPSTTDVPGELSSHLLERGDGPGPFGSKGLGESSIITVAPAISNAVAAATGVRVRELPLSPWTVWRALRQAREAGP